ncbi:CRP/FNR family transcriptional regulator [Microvirga flocculans]|uniref:CRP/FNR family transcriptional regulator n=1 Tax=Microvirga flocculans TaxID=217168 RepID=A0A7W6IF46_9HYPH|nr:helix-turn-helix domain-containing protein [Microvirga flocculans]MBB4040341.1 CRP/FNR family transcriptional regulator [Microvirga flocculans]
MYSSHLTSLARGAAHPAFALQSNELTLESLFAAQPAERLPSGAAAFWEGDPATHLLQVAEGCLRLYRVLGDGRRAVIGFRFVGELIGISCYGSYSYTAEAVTHVRIRRITRTRLQAREQEIPEIRPLVMAKMFQEMDAAQRHIIVLGQLGAEERVAHFLVSAAMRMGGEQGEAVLIDLPMTRLDIADYLGLTIETVCRAMSKLKHHGIIALDGRHSVTVLRLSDLRSMAGDVDDLSGFHDQCALAQLPN